MSNDIQEYMLSHCLAIKTAETALQGYIEDVNNAS